MNTCYNCEKWEEKYDRLERKYDRLSNSYSELERRFNKSEDELREANWKVKYELEPRIKNEHRSYNDYVISGGSDECFRSGMSGKCGVECPIFGEKAECYDSFTKEEQILELYATETTTNYLIELIDKMGLQEKCKEIDRKYYQDEIDNHKKSIHKLEELLSVI